MMFKPSKNPKVAELTKSVKERSYNLTCLQAIKLDELNVKGKQKRLCAWCVEIELFHGNQKYCSELCSRSAMAWSYPQKEDSLRFLLVQQDWKCSDCLYDYRPTMQGIIDRERQQCRTMDMTITIDELPWYYFKRLKAIVPKERKPEVDHILALCKGGDSLGIFNHQILCYTCHKNKTKRDLSGKRK